MSRKGSSNVVKGKTSPVAHVAGRAKIVDTLSQKDLDKEIQGLKDELRATQSMKDRDNARREGKRLRRMLRTRGSWGGLGIVAKRDASRVAS